MKREKRVNQNKLIRFAALKSNQIRMLGAFLKFQKYTRFDSRLLTFYVSKRIIYLIEHTVLFMVHFVE